MGKAVRVTPQDEAAITDALSKLCELVADLLEQQRLTNELLMEIGK